MLPETIEVPFQEKLRWFFKPITFLPHDLCFFVLNITVDEDVEVRKEGSADGTYNFVDCFVPSQTLPNGKFGFNLIERIRLIYFL